MGTGIKSGAQLALCPDGRPPHSACAANTEVNRDDRQWQRGADSKAGPSTSGKVLSK